MRWALPGLLACLAALAVFGVAVTTKPARHDRVWRTHLSRLPIVSLTEKSFSIETYRDWTYADDAPVRQAWRGLPAHDLADVRRVWLIVEPHPGLDVMAHTLVVFEFETGEPVGLTVEARKQAGEPYSVVRGALNAFELIYQWASPKDLLTRRAVMMDKELYLYPLKLSQAEAEAYLRALLEETVRIEARPRFYNTLTSNCTNELAKTAGLPWRPAFVLTGRSAEALYAMDRIDTALPFEALQTRARIDLLVREIADLEAPEFFATLTRER